MSHRHVFVQVPVDHLHVLETATLDRRISHVQQVPRPWVRPLRGRALAAVRSRVRWVLRALGLALFASPLLAVARFLFGALRASVASAIVVVFVLLVVAFFAVLNLFVLVSLVLWLLRRIPHRPALNRPVSARPPLLAAPPATEHSAPGERVVAKGTVVGLLPRAGKGPLVVDAWSAQERRTEADDFAIRRAPGEAPVVLRMETAPLLVGGNEVHEGDEVAVIGRVRAIVDSADRIELGGEVRAVPRLHGDTEGAYRQAPAGPAIVIGDRPHEPATIVIVRSARGSR